MDNGFVISGVSYAFSNVENEFCMKVLKSVLLRYGFKNILTGVHKTEDTYREEPVYLVQTLVPMLSKDLLFLGALARYMKQEYYVEVWNRSAYKVKCQQRTRIGNWLGYPTDEVPDSIKTYTYLPEEAIVFYTN